MPAKVRSIFHRGPDGVVREVPMAFSLTDKPVPSLDAEVLRLITGGTVEVTTAETGLSSLFAHDVVKTLSAGSLSCGFAPNGGVEVYFAKRSSDRFVSAADLDQGHLASGVLKGAIVYISSPVRNVVTPMGLRARAEVRAEALENMLLGEELKPVTTPEGELAFIAILGVGLIVLFLCAEA